MSIIRKFLNKLFRKSNIPMITDVTKQNYNEYRKTYDTLSKVFGQLDTIDVFIIGGISAAIQTKQDLYRQNSDIDIMCNEEDLSILIKTLQKLGYSIDDRRNIKTRNIINLDGHFQARDHELNANTRKKNMLGVGMFTYQTIGNDVITHSYAFEEKEGKFVGIEKVIPKELFNLMYDSKTVDYKGLKLKTESKEYIYLTKSKGSREKDNLDVSIIKAVLDDESKRKIDRIGELEAKTKTYKLLYKKDGSIESRIKLPTLEEKINVYLNNLFLKYQNKTPEQITTELRQSNEYQRMIVDHPEIDILIKNWQEKSKEYTYQDKIKLLTEHYSKKLENFNKETIDNALDFLHQRYINHGSTNNDIKLTNEAIKIFKLMQEYGESIKQIFIDNNIDITHITTVSPEKLEGGMLKKSLDRANHYETKRVDGVFASSNPIDGYNPYLARNSSGMIKLNNSTYIYGSDNIEIIQNSDGKKEAILKYPNYIYHINPENFVPVCNLAIDSYTHRPTFVFSQEWISNTAIDVSDKNQVRSVEEVRNVTSLLKHYTVLCDIQSQGIGIKAKQLSQKSKTEALQYVIKKINDGSLRNINHEAGINDRNLFGIDR